jgi:two-component system chemotaxis response regulator CheY
MGSRILIVDDDSITRKFIGFILRAEGFQVAFAQDGIEALEILAGVSIDLVITDLNMPKMDGLELIQAIRKDLQSSEMPVLMLTTEGDEESRKCGYDAGASAYMVKPVSREVLAEKIRELVDCQCL